MDNFRKPEMIIAIIAIIAVIAIAIYFYRKQGTQQEEIGKYGERMAHVVKKISEMPQHTHLGQIMDNFKTQDALIVKQSQTITTLTSEVEELRYLVDIMSEHMEDMGHRVRLPRRSALKGKSGKGRKGVNFRRDDDNDDDDDTEKDKDKEKVDVKGSEDDEEEEQEQPRKRPVRGRRTTTTKDDESDDDLTRRIEAVRAQRKRD